MELFRLSSVLRDRLNVLLVVTMIMISINYCSSDNSNNMCKRIKAKAVKDIVMEPCTESYKARCAWYSLTFCTFYHKVYCTRTSNKTKSLYYEVTECCEGFIKAPNATCLNVTLLDEDFIEEIQNNTIKNEDKYVNIEDIPTHPPVKVKPPRSIKLQDDSSTVEGPELSHGAYAGIACAVLFLIIIVAFVIIAVRKRKQKMVPRRKKSKDSLTAIQCVALQSTSPIVRNKNTTNVATPEEKQSLNDHVSTET